MKIAVTLLILIFCPAGFATEFEHWPLPIPQNEKLNVVVAKFNAKSKTQKLPVLLLLSGFQTSDKVVDMVTTSEPLMVVSFGYPYQENPDLSVLDKIKEVPKIKNLIHLTLGGILSLVEKLVERTDVDPTRISILGGSFGSPFAIVAAEKSPHITGLIVLNGFADIAPPMQVQLERAWSSDLKVFANPLAFLTSRLATAYLNFPDPQTSIEHLRPNQKALLLTAENDVFIPKGVTQSMWAAFESSKAKTFRRDLSGSHIVAAGSPDLKKITLLTIEWLKENRLL